MAYVPPLPVIRKQHIIERLRRCNAVSKETAKTLKDAGVINPDGFGSITRLLCSRRILIRTEDKYYLGI